MKMNYVFENEKTYMNTIDQRIKALEVLAGYVPGRVPGTTISRVVTTTDVSWCLALGLMQDVKKFFSGKTIEECLTKAEKKLKSKIHE